jgi:hypothetical protein
VVSVIRGGLFGVLDYHGNEVIPIKHPVAGFHHLSEVQDGKAVYYDRQSNMCIVVTRDGEQLGTVPPTYWSSIYPKACPSLSDGLMLINQMQRNGKTQSYFVDPYGNFPMKNWRGKPRIFDETERLDYFGEGLAHYRKDDLGGYIDKAGKMVIPQQFEAAGTFKNGLAKVFRTRDDRIKDRYSYINKTGDEVARNY